MATTYTVHYRYDDRHGTPGQWQTDHPYERGDVIYPKNGRAFVRSCITNRAVDDTYRRNARTLHALSRPTSR